jgi:hypothetical protein
MILGFNRLFAISIVLTGLLAQAETVFADQYHYTNTNVGDRPAGMGGAYTAVSDDAAGVWYNPAGIVFATGNSVSASVNSIIIQDKNYANTLGSGVNYDRTSQNLLPNFFGVIQKTPFGTVGFSYVVPDSVLQQQDTTYGNATGDSSYTINYNNDYNVYEIGPSIGIDSTKNLKFGASLYFHYKRQKTITNTLETQASNGRIFWNNNLFKIDEYGFKPIIGVLWSPEDGKYSVGMSATSTFILSSSQYFQSAAASGGAVSYSPSANLSASEIASYPVTVKIGAAWFPNSALLIATDLSYTTSANSSTYTYQWARVPVVNLAAGLEYFISPTFAVRTGVFTDNSNVGSQSIAGNPSVADDKVDMLGYALSFTYFQKSTAITVGFNYGYGNGLGNLSGTVNPLTVQTGSLFLGSSYSY